MTGIGETSLRLESNAGHRLLVPTLQLRLVLGQHRPDSAVEATPLGFDQMAQDFVHAPLAVGRSPSAERVPERVVHAKGSGAFGYFEVTADCTPWTKAAFLNKVGKRTPMLARFSTVAGEQGYADTDRRRGGRKGGFTAIDSH